MTATHTVRYGDTLKAIARRHETSLANLLHLNPEIEHPDQIHPGQSIHLPDPGARMASTGSAGCVVASAPCQDEIVDILHATGDDTLYLLTEADLHEIEREEDFVRGPIDAYYESLSTTEETASAADSPPTDHEENAEASTQVPATELLDELDHRGVLHSNSGQLPKLTEIKRLRGHRHYTYIRSDRMRNHWRSYRMDAQDRNRSQNWLTRDGIDGRKLGEALRSDLGIRLNARLWAMDEDEGIGAVLNQLRREFSSPTYDNGPGFNASAGAQFLRFSAGATTMAQFNPGRGHVHLQAAAQAEMALAEGRVEVSQVFPVGERSEIRVPYRIGGPNGERKYTSLGHFQARLTLAATGFAGGSALISANLHVDCSDGTPRFRGDDPRQRQNQGAQVGAGAFAGIRAGGSIKGELRWADQLTRQQSWRTLCRVGQRVEAAAGAGAEGEVSLHFDPDTGKFLLRAQAGLVLGLGASGRFLVEVDAVNIYTMLHFVYQALGQTDFRYLELFDSELQTFQWYTRLGLHAVTSGISYQAALHQAITEGTNVVREAASAFLGGQRRGFRRERDSVALARNVIADIDRGSESVLRHAPPEVKGPVLEKLVYNWGLTPRLVDGTRTQVRAVAHLLTTFQSGRDASETLMRMNPEARADPDRMHANGIRVFRFIGRNQYWYEVFWAALENTTPDLSGGVRLDPHGACRQAGIT